MLFGLIGSLLDCLTFFPLEIVVLLAMLQDRHRPLWPVAFMGQPAGAQQLALESGFSSYRTFSDAFKRKMGQSVTVWIKEGKAQREGLE